MNKLAVTFLVLFLVIALFAAFVWYFAAALSPDIPNNAEIVSLEETVNVSWYPYGTDIQYSGSNLDAYRAIGFTHAIRHPWFMALLRQTALGELGSWFDTDLTVLDSLIHVIDIPRSARRASESITQRSSAVLRAYADGVNAGFETGRVYRDESFLAIDEVPEEWMPWHSLAIEKLYAWVAASEILTTTDSLNHLPLVRASAHLMEWLQTGGFNDSAIWSIENSDSTVTGVRFVSGSSRIPVIVPAITRAGSEQDRTSFLLLGTPFEIFQMSSRSAHLILPASSAAISTVSADSASIQIDYDRITDFDGNEHLVERPRLGPDLVVECLPRGSHADSSDSTWTSRCTVLNWIGLGAVTDADAWLSRPEDREFSLWTGQRIAAYRDGRFVAESAGSIPSAFGSKVTVVGSGRWTPHIRARLVELSSGQWSAGIIPEDVKSVWAEDTLRVILPPVTASRGDSVRLSAAITYLRNWDFDYSRASIAASILEGWTKQLGILRDRQELAGDESIDSTVYARSLRVALDSLEAAYGSDMSEWRWETVNGRHFEYPAWGFIRKNFPAARKTYSRIISRNSAADSPARGHPTTIHWSPTDLSGPVSFSSSLYITINSADWESVSVTSASYALGIDDRTISPASHQSVSFIMGAQTPDKTTTLRRP